MNPKQLLNTQSSLLDDEIQLSLLLITEMKYTYIRVLGIPWITLHGHLINWDNQLQGEATITDSEVVLKCPQTPYQSSALEPKRKASQFDKGVCNSNKIVSLKCEFNMPSHLSPEAARKPVSALRFIDPETKHTSTTTLATNKPDNRHWIKNHAIILRSTKHPASNPIRIGLVQNILRIWTDHAVCSIM